MYICSNLDFHGENFGFLYDTKSFDILDVAPAYDFNSAFESWGDIKVFDPVIVEMLPEIINSNLNLIPRLKTLDKILGTDKILSKESKNEILSRVEYVLGLVNKSQIFDKEDLKNKVNTVLCFDSANKI